MKKNENDNSVAHFYSLCEEWKKLKDDIAKQQKRLWLRTKIHEITGLETPLTPTEKDSFEEIFDWIFQAPIYEWEGMLYCFNHEYKIVIDSPVEKFSIESNIEYALENAKVLYSFLK